MSDNEKRIDLIYGELLNRCWKDEKYLERFRKEPKAVLAEAGIPVKAGAAYHVMEQSKDKLFLILPENFPAEKLDDLKAEIKEKAGLGEDAVIEVLHNTDTDVYLSYFPAPEFQPLSDDDLTAVAAGKESPVKKPVVGPTGPGTENPDKPEDPPYGPDLYTYTENYMAVYEQIGIFTEVYLFLAAIG